MSFFKNIIKFIKGWRLDKFFKGFTNGDEQSAKDLQDTVEKASLLVNNIKNWIASPTGDMIVKVIPGDWDEALRVKAKAFIEKVIGNTAILTGCIDKPSVGEQLTCIFSKIVALNDEDEVKSLWHKIAVFATKVFSDGKLTFSDAILAAQLVYEMVIKKKDTPKV